MMNEKILLACRDDECRSDLQAFLCREGLSVHRVHEDADLLLELLHGDFQLVIYDLEFCGSDGLKMVRIIRMIRPKVAIVVLSRNTDLELGGKVLQEGVTHYCVKPIDQKMLKEVFCSVLQLPQSLR